MTTSVSKAVFIGVTTALALISSGCGGTQSPAPAQSAKSTGASTDQAQVDEHREEAVAEDPELVNKLAQTFSDIIEEVSAKYHPIVYHYDEDLLSKISAAHAFLSGAKPEPRPARLIAEIDENEEDEHLRETIKRWSSKTGRDFGKAIAELESALASVDRSKPVHPEFHRAFSKVFDDFIAIEVPEMRERRNRVIHRRVREMLAPHVGTKPKVVRHFQQLIAVPPYLDPDTAPH